MFIHCSGRHEINLRLCSYNKKSLFRTNDSPVQLSSAPCVIFGPMCSSMAVSRRRLGPPLEKHLGYFMPHVKVLLVHHVVQQAHSTTSRRHSDGQYEMASSNRGILHHSLFLRSLVELLCTSILFHYNFHSEDLRSKVVVSNTQGSC